MGNRSSTDKRRPPSSPPPKLDDKPWRSYVSTFESLKSDISEIQPEFTANILLLGPAGSGKSSTINSFLSVAAGRRKNVASTGIRATSFTTTFGHYNDKGFLKNCCLCDSMGLEQVLDGGLHLDDLVNLLKGHIKKNYQFNTRSKIKRSDTFYRRNPWIEDQIHCVVFVLEAPIIDENILGPYISKIKAFQDGTKDLDIPFVLILTKIDKLCEAVADDIRTTFRSTAVHKAVTKANEILGIPEGNIHPIVNFELDIETTEEKSIYILLAMRQIMQYASDQIEKLSADEKWRCIMA